MDVVLCLIVVAATIVSVLALREGILLVREADRDVELESENEQWRYESMRDFPEETTLLESEWEITQRLGSVFNVVIGDEQDAVTVASCIVSDWHGSPYLYRLWVAPDYRRRGFATELLSAAIDEFGFLGLRIEPVPFADKPMSQERLTQWCQHLGFVPDELNEDVLVYGGKP